MALVITLILLSVTLVMAVAFLSISRRERNAVTTTTDTASARLAADAALAHAEAQIVVNLFVTNAAAYNFSLLVSTNYINGFGFVPNSANPTNVNYDYTSTGNPLTAAQLQQNIANLFYLPRAPVYLSNFVFHTMENRFYLDLNRNGTNERNGNLPMIGRNGGFLHPDGTEDNNPANVVTNFQVGDPEWIGVLERPDTPHGPNNKFVARYAFIALPVGNTLDLNAIHNQVFDENNAINATVNPSPNGDAYFRNEGVGSWEINLAAFLADLNTNQWGKIIDLPQALGGPVGGSGFYQYNKPYDINTANWGSAFDDARALLAYRYANNYNSLLPVYVNPVTPSVFGVNGDFAFRHDNIDGYSDGPLQTTFNTNEFFLPDNPQLPWAGADNTNQFFTHQELFDPIKTSVGFTNRLWSAGTNVATYDRYTFYRMLDELGSDSTPESGKMNVNYDNLDPFVTVVGGITVTNAPASTNFMTWQPLSFFTKATDRLLRLYTTNWFRANPTNYLATYYGLTNISFYTYYNGATTVTNDPNGLGLTNIPFLGMTNQLPVFGITNIPVWVNGQFVYTPAVNRLLQLAANIYDATTNSFYPSVFRPIFEHDNFGNVFITGYTTLSSASGPNTVSGLGLDDPQLATPYDVLQLFSLFPAVINTPITDANGFVNVYGVPWIIGAKKGLPNFNEFSFESMVTVTRKLEITRPSIDALLSDYQTNQMYILSITNQLGVECWNSYSSNYTSSSQVQIMARDSLSMMLTNQEAGGATMPPLTFVTSPYVMSSTVSLPLQAGLYTWPGSAPWVSNRRGSPPSPSAMSFDIPLTTNTFLLTNSIYRYSAHQFIPAENPATTNYVDKGIFPMPQFGLLTTNRLQVVILDGNHVIDYVQFAGPDSSRNLNAEIADYDPNNPNNGLWNTNYSWGGTIPNGVVNQIYFAEDPQRYKYNPAGGGLLTANDAGTWQSPQGGGPIANSIAALNAFLNANHYASNSKDLQGNTASASNLDLSVQVPFTPTRVTYQYISWQAKDPLVHYVASDLNYTGAEPGGLQTGTHLADITWTNLPANNLRLLNDRYQPWGIPNTDTNAYNLAVKDPLVRMSDNWDFPTNKLPGIGWLGRVHRGTPWQSVYLKASNILSPVNGTNTWVTWTGNVNTNDAVNSAPKQDRLLFDVFTTAFNDNATRGQLSVNQPHLAAWSALFSGLVVLSNTNNASDRVRMSQVPQYQNPPPIFTNMVIQPAGSVWTTNSPMWQLWNGITQWRAVVTNTDGVVGAFEHAGDILLVPQLTQQSPFLNWNDSLQQQNGISDEMYEWLPQQVMSLLRDGPPRYVIYCYGQALKPAPDSLVTSGGNNVFGMCTNYQVVAESAARAVVRVEGAGTPTPHVVVESINPLPPD